VSEKLAAHLAKLGFNAVRFHHMDNDWGNPDATIFDYSYDDTQHLSAQSLTRLDYLIYQLKRHGIYTNLNLHVSRQFRPDDGVRDADLFDPSTFNKNATLFDPVMIALQKKYAHDLLTHLNPYTSLRYVDDPAVLCTEITNEDSFFLGWAHDQLVYDPEKTESLPLAYSEELDGRGINRLMNGGFEDDPTDFSPWLTWTEGTAAANFALDETTAAEGYRSLRVEVTQVDGVDWHVQFWQEGLAVQAGHAYTVSFAAKAAQPTTVGAFVMNSESPWNNYGSAEDVALTTAWQWYTYTFTATVTGFGGARLSFDLGQTETALWFDGLHFEDCDRFPGWLGWLRDRYGTTAAISAAWAPT
ncbi:MAG: carbohydrate binding domain-containing protein, partial [Planctomycetes bacterium]|nr:carbohydrate binding domain-containing protein [Planctomycetota bacterium]